MTLFLLVLLALSFVRLGAQAPDASFADLADSAAVVVTGRVAGVAVGADAGAIYTYATVTVGEVLKGRVADGTLVVKQLGGTLPTLGLYIADQASFAPQEDVLLFLNVRPRDGTLYTVGLSRGKWRLLPDLATGGVSAVQGSARVPLDQAARRAVGASRAQSDAFVATPPEFDLARPNFTFIPGSEGGPARWHEADDGARIAIDFQDGTDRPGSTPGSVAGTRSAHDFNCSGVSQGRPRPLDASTLPTATQCGSTGTIHVATFLTGICRPLESVEGISPQGFRRPLTESCSTSSCKGLRYSIRTSRIAPSTPAWRMRLLTCWVTPSASATRVTRARSCMRRSAAGVPPAAAAWPVTTSTACAPSIRR